ncbi:MAG: hypothetical protein M1823_002967 [Watsoniomyces obsoletus]|nr:MAG: hypothetical protein M1823_002967 [Watsoniomyces obsoletus]
MRRDTPSSSSSAKSPTSTQKTSLHALLLPRSFSKPEVRSASVGGRLRSRRWRRKPRMAGDPTALLSPTLTTDQLDPEQASITVSEPSPTGRLGFDQSEVRLLLGESEAREASVHEETILPAYLRQTKSDKFQELEWVQRLRLLEGRQNPDPSFQWAQEQDSEIKFRNRYANVQPWTNNRIHLKVAADECDYINASPILLVSSKTGQEKRYIAAQGPRSDELAHFWQMVWHETSEPTVIVMLTQTFESGREKCFPYFPESLENDTLSMSGGEESREGSFSGEIKLLRIEEHASTRSTIRELQLTVNGEHKTVYHLLFGVWPDFCTPEGDDQAALLRLIRLSRELSRSPQNPRIVHCSAGVGRSGTFIALDHLLAELEEGALDDPPVVDDDDTGTDIIFNVVDGLRQQRMMMVQSDAQLSFIYEIVKQQWLARKNGHAGIDDAQEEEAGGVQGFNQPTMVADRGPEIMISQDTDDNHSDAPMES